MHLRANVLLSIGTVLATLGGARLPTVEWRLVALGSLVLVAGGVMHRMASRKSRETRQGPEVSMTDTLRAVADELQALSAKGPSLTLPQLVERLGALENGSLGQVGEAIPQQLATLGGARFAEVFGEYAAGERMVHRAWSAAADGHREEALRSLEEGARRIHASLGMLEKAA